MRNKYEYKSEILGIIHQDALSRYEAGLITKDELDRFNNVCLVCDYKRLTKPIEIPAEKKS
jgi:hypothetical protein